ESLPKIPGDKGAVALAIRCESVRDFVENKRAIVPLFADNKRACVPESVPGRSWWQIWRECWKRRRRRRWRWRWIDRDLKTEFGPAGFVVELVIRKTAPDQLAPIIRIAFQISDAET